jgi:hypothetical protein
MIRLVVFFYVLSFINIQAQTVSDEVRSEHSKHELKVNVIFLAAGVFDVGYEKLLNSESSLGLVVTVPVRSGFDLNFALEGYCRMFLGKKYAAGFFVEGFSLLNNAAYDYIENRNNSSVLTKKNFTDVAFGIGLGSKWVTNSGLIIELNAGLGRQMFRPTQSGIGSEFIGKGGIILGYRF